MKWTVPIVVAVLILIPLTVLISLQAQTNQTKIDGPSQIKNLMALAPVQSIQRSTCVPMNMPSGAIATAVAVNPTTVTVTVTAGGTDYPAVPSVYLTGGGGTYTSITATVAAGAITSVMVNGAVGYTSNPTVVFPTSDCSGIQLMQLKLTDGTVLGPYVMLPATPLEVSNVQWVTIPINSTP
jgi:hypothetical protein